MYKSGTWTLGRVCWDLGLGDTRRRTWGHQVWDAGRWDRDARDVNDYRIYSNKRRSRISAAPGTQKIK